MTVDQIDEHVAVVRFEQPLLGRPLSPHPRLDERLERALGLVLADEEVDVVVRPRTTPCPGGQPSAEHERDVGVAERGCGSLHARDEILEISAIR